MLEEANLIRTTTEEINEEMKTETKIKAVILHHPMIAVPKGIIQHPRDKLDQSLYSDTHLASPKNSTSYLTKSLTEEKCNEAEFGRRS